MLYINTLLYLILILSYKYNLKILIGFCLYVFIIIKNIIRIEKNIILYR